MAQAPNHEGITLESSSKLAENLHSDQKTAAKLPGRMKIIPNNRGGERKGRGESIPHLGSHGKSQCQPEKDKIELKSHSHTCDVQPKPHSMNSQWQLSSSVPCACHSPFPMASPGPHPSSCVTIHGQNLYLGEHLQVSGKIITC